MSEELCRFDNSFLPDSLQGEGYDGSGFQPVHRSLGSKPCFPRVALLGTGLMGGSLGMALRERRLVGKIAGFDRDPESLCLAMEKGAVDQICENPAEAVKGAALVILAVPVQHCSALVRQCRDYFSPGTIVTDLGSTKEHVVREIKKNLPSGIEFVGGHPMTGSEEAGIRAADPALFENAIYVLTPPENTSVQAIEALKMMIENIGSQVLLMSPAEHDRMMAMVSHLPHLAAVSLVSVAANGDKNMIQTLAAGGFRDTTRVAMGNPEIWRDICATNQNAIDLFLTSYIKELASLRRILRQNDEEELNNVLVKARNYRREIPQRGRGILPEIYEVIALVKDNPGTIGRIATLMGDEGLNIAAIEILHVREENGGSIKLGFRDCGQRDRALGVLQKHGYRAHKR